MWCNSHKGRINSFIQLMSLSRWGASLARNWRGCFNGIVVIHGVCGRVASARISCFRASCGLAKHRYWLNMAYMLHPCGSKDPTRRWQLTFPHEALWEESQGMLLPSVWNAFCGESRSQTTGKTRKQQLNNTRKKYWISGTRKEETNGLSIENSLMGLTDFWALINVDILHM